MDKTIATITKNAREQINVGFNEFSGHQLCHVRVYAEHRDTGELVPTKKGITFKLELLPEIIDALKTALSEAQAAGLITTGREAA